MKQLYFKKFTRTRILLPQISYASKNFSMVLFIPPLDFSFETRYHYFFSDVVEGLNAPDDPGNKNNDTMITANIGIIYVFGKN